VFGGKNAAGNRVLNAHLPWSNGRVYWDAGNSGSAYDRQPLPPPSKANGTTGPLPKMPPRGS
jgi:hypothetical protein